MHKTLLLVAILLCGCQAQHIRDMLDGGARKPALLLLRAPQKRDDGAGLTACACSCVKSSRWRAGARPHW